MRARLGALLLALVPTLALGAVCRTLEFAELESIPPEQLVRMRCQYDADGKAYIDISLKSAQGGSTLASQRDLEQATRCSQEVDRMDRIIARKYGIAGDSKTVLLAVNAKCREQPK